MTFLLHFALILSFLYLSFGQPITNCSNCPSHTCTALSDNSNSGLCCGMVTNGTKYCTTYCIPAGQTCCGCNYLNGVPSCVSCEAGESCATYNGTGIYSSSIIYYCDGISLLPSVFVLVVLTIIGLGF